MSFEFASVKYLRPTTISSIVQWCVPLVDLVFLVTGGLVMLSSSKSSFFLLIGVDVAVNAKTFNTGVTTVVSHKQTHAHSVLNLTDAVFVGWAIDISSVLVTSTAGVVFEIDTTWTNDVLVNDDC